ncbi:hypothetical protein MSMEI_4490 [Mycolicibacterium smegmatis MC2 155]|uniref:Thioesterase-like superfamily protein n=2 Tax=Mycolicibacterium smegmatis TaxID=1772 RepID=I7GDT6_MYCS2|nr:hypothetical protein MSMEI_4490 [Mycolicibacterium smegmatis MC2 155]SUA33303.1 Uncharacterised protein [Mycolicibacterium smegmatis]VTP07108.1 hypothetical protein BIN_B_01426 [Mycolicibacterium smegmatis]
MIGCHYRRAGADRDYQLFESTADTRSNWDESIQHGSPPLALLTKAIEELMAGSGLRVGRLTLDILGAIPVATVRVRVWVGAARFPHLARSRGDGASRPDGKWRAVAKVSAWLLAASDTSDVTTDRHPPLIEGEPADVPHNWVGAPGYLDTVTWRRQITPDGAAAEVWMSPLTPAVDDEETTALQRLALVVDSPNGVGAALHPKKFIFMNTDTTVRQEPADTRTAPSGTLAATTKSKSLCTASVLRRSRSHASTACRTAEGSSNGSTTIPSAPVNRTASSLSTPTPNPERTIDTSVCGLATRLPAPTCTPAATNNAAISGDTPRAPAPLPGVTTSSPANSANGTEDIAASR